jgi:aspartate carbamoyltransferase catalytic subunit
MYKYLVGPSLVGGWTINSTRLKHLTKSQQFSQELVAELFERADRFRVNPASGVLTGKTMIELFYEPSTRTRMSFASAMHRLGGNVIATENAREFSSAVKGETLEDTARVVGAYGHVIVIRHYEEGAADRMAAASPIPVINAGDGKGQHPTQALLDLYTIKKEVGTIENITVAFVGDLANGRTVRSLAYLLAHVGRVRMIFISQPHLRIGQDIKDTTLKHHNVEYWEVDSFESLVDGKPILPNVDVVYATRPQKERMTPEQYEAAKGKLIIGIEQLSQMKPTARLMHPLPKTDEVNLPPNVEQDDKRVAYFRQSANGIPIRMALLEHLVRD